MNHSIDKLNSLVINGKIRNAVVFSDTRIRGLYEKIILINRQTRLKWSDLFKYLIDSKMNKEAIYVLEPNCYNIPDLKGDGVKLIDNGLYLKNFNEVYKIHRHIFTDYHFLDANININKIKVASICHLYYEDLLEELIPKLKGLSRFDTKYFFTLTQYNSSVGQKEWIQKKLKKEFPNSEILILPNKGLDIGPLFKTLEHIFKTKQEFDYIVKTHTKKSLKTSGEYFGQTWRKDLLDILDIEKIDEPLKSKEAMIGSKKWIVPIEKDALNKNNIEALKEELNIKKGHQFVAGTMFWLKMSILKRYFNEDLFNKYYNLLESGYFYQIDASHGEYLTHSFERIFGLMIGNEDKKIKGV